MQTGWRRRRSPRLLARGRKTRRAEPAVAQHDEHRPIPREGPDRVRHPPRPRGDPSLPRRPRLRRRGPGPATRVMRLAIAPNSRTTITPASTSHLPVVESGRASLGWALTASSSRPVPTAASALQVAVTELHRDESCCEDGGHAHTGRDGGLDEEMRKSAQGKQREQEPTPSSNSPARYGSAESGAVVEGARCGIGRRASGAPAGRTDPAPKQGAAISASIAASDVSSRVAGSHRLGIARRLTAPTVEPPTPSSERHGAAGRGPLFLSVLSALYAQAPTYTPAECDSSATATWNGDHHVSSRPTRPHVQPPS